VKESAKIEIENNFEAWYRSRIGESDPADVYVTLKDAYVAGAVDFMPMSDPGRLAGLERAVISLDERVSKLGDVVSKLVEMA